MLGQKFDCPICQKKSQLYAIQNNPGNMLGYLCQACHAKFAPDYWLDEANKTVVLLAKHENPELSKVACSSDIAENVRALDKFRKEGHPWFLETYTIGTEPMLA